MLQDLCHAPIPLDDTLDSLDEAPEIQEQQQQRQAAPAFIMGDSSGDSDVETAVASGSQKRFVPPSIFTTITATMLGTMGSITGKTGGEASDVGKRGGPSHLARPTQPAKKKSVATDEESAIPRGLVAQSGPSPPPINSFAMTPLTSKDETVTINVEEEQ